MAVAAKHHSPLAETNELVCWTRMQSEAGQRLEAIVARKETERRAGNGVFFWGVGNAPAVVTPTYARLRVPVKVVFSIMKGRPRAVDSSPRRVMVWRRYLDMHGIEQELPPQVLLTSRGDTDRGDKKRHYALMCRSASPLCIERGVSFDSTAYRNAGSNRGQVGASQVTALLQRVAEDALGNYEANLTAELVDSYWVRLTDPVVLDAASVARVERAGEAASPQEWVRLVAEVRQGSREVISRTAAQPSFF